MKKLLAIAALAVSLSGCATVGARAKYWRGATDPFLYPSTQGVWKCAVTATRSSWLLLELPLAFAVDTVFLPFDYVYSVRSYLR